MDNRDRVISITLTESVWQALVARHPRPVDWLRTTIHDEIGHLLADKPRDPKQVVYEAQLAMRGSHFITE